TRIAARQPPWPLDALACAALPELLAAADLPKWARLVSQAREDLGRVLLDAGLRPEPSDANFVLVRDAGGLRDHLARRGVLVRDTASFGLTGGVRIAAPDHNGLDRLAGALAARSA